jgi:hypothetical protein
MLEKRKPEAMERVLEQDQESSLDTQGPSHSNSGWWEKPGAYTDGFVDSGGEMNKLPDDIHTVTEEVGSSNVWRWQEVERLGRERHEAASGRKGKPAY